MAKYYFYLPENLTTDQQNALDDPESISIYGGPGTGKTVVNLWRHIRNHENGRNSLLLTYTKTLEHYLKGSANNKNPKAAQNIDRTYRWTYNNNKQNHQEIIIDEAQDVQLDRYGIIQKYSKSISYGADPDQSVYLSSKETKEVLDNLTKMFDTNKHTLYKNFRNSKDILLFTQAIFPEICIEQETIEQAEANTLPLISIVGWDDENMVNKITEIIEEFSSDASNIGILLPTQNQVLSFYELLKDNFDCSKYVSKGNDNEEENESDGIFEELKNIHITTFKSAKGIEFNSVIIPNFDSYIWFMKNTNVSMNEYYVALTRAKTNLFLICKKQLNSIDNTTYKLEN